MIHQQWQKSEHSQYYLLYRWILAIFSVVSLGQNVFFDYETGVLRYYLINQPHLNLVFFMVVMVAGALLINTRQMKDSKLFMQAYDVLWHHTLTWSFCVSGIYWMGLQRASSSYNIIFAHWTISLIFFCDLYIIRCYHRFRSFVITLIYTVCYLAFTFGYEFFGGIEK